MSAFYRSWWKHIKSINFGLFTRSFLLFSLLLVVSISAWLTVFFSSQETPRALSLAQRSAATLNIIQTTLSHIPSYAIGQVMQDISSNRTTILLPYSPQDIKVDLPSASFWTVYQQRLAYLTHNRNVKVYGWVNGLRGIWIHFHVGTEQYWLRLEDLRTHDSLLPESIGWGVIALILAINGAAISVRYVNAPLARLARVAQQMARHEKPDVLPETGPYEIQKLNQAFNRMTHELMQTEKDRELMLAGISHDLRTPLTRIRLEIEMCHLPPASQQAIEQDILQIDHCINQLIDYTRTIQHDNLDTVDVSAVLHDLCQREKVTCAQQNIQLDVQIEPDLRCQIQAINLCRIISNLIENARRYGVSDTHRIIGLHAYRERHLVIEVWDQGQGIDASQITNLLRPFARGETARSNTKGTGLGLAIVERLVSHAEGQLRLLQNQPHGLRCRIELPFAKKT